MLFMDAMISLEFLKLELKSHILELIAKTDLIKYRMSE